MDMTYCDVLEKTLKSVIEYQVQVGNGVVQSYKILADAIDCYDNYKAMLTKQNNKLPLSIVKVTKTFETIYHTGGKNEQTY